MKLIQNTTNKKILNDTFLEGMILIPKSLMLLPKGQEATTFIGI